MFYWDPDLRKNTFSEPLIDFCKCKGTSWPISSIYFWCFLWVWWWVPQIPVLKLSCPLCHKEGVTVHWNRLRAGNRHSDSFSSSSSSSLIVRSRLKFRYRVQTPALHLLEWHGPSKTVSPSLNSLIYKLTWQRIHKFMLSDCDVGGQKWTRHRVGALLNNIIPSFMMSIVPKD